MPATPSTPSSILHDLASLSRAATETEALLLAWLGKRAAAKKSPTIQEISSATRTLSSLTAIRKTLLAMSPTAAGPATPPTPPYTPEEFEEILRRADFSQNPNCTPLPEENGDAAEVIDGESDDNIHPPPPSN